MGKILAVDDDHATLVLIEGALALAGHDTLITADPEVLMQLLAAESIDALILDLNMPKMSGFDVLHQLREQPRWRTLPVLLISAQIDPETRARGLRDGADDFLAKPFVADELIASIERMMARQSSDTGLQGSLERFPTPELLQYLAGGGKTGFLEIARRGRPAEILFRGGLVVAATAGNLNGREAVLETLTMTEGFFHFEFDDRPSSNAPAVQIDLQSALFESAWLDDELEKRRDSLPAEDQPLVVLDHRFEKLENFEELPASEVHRFIGSHPGIRLQEILGEGIAASVKVRLTIALLVTGGTIALAPSEDPKALQDLLRTFAPRSRDPKLVHLMMIASPAAWESWLDLFASVPEQLLPTQSRHLFEQLRDRGRGTLRLSLPDRSSIIFHLLPLNAEVEIDPAVLETAAGVVVQASQSGPEPLSACLRTLDDPAGALRSDAARILLDCPSVEAPLWRSADSVPTTFDDFVQVVTSAVSA